MISLIVISFEKLLKLVTWKYKKTPFAKKDEGAVRGTTFIYVQSKTLYILISNNGF